MASKSKASRGTRRTRTFNLNPATRAIRHALALSLAIAAAQPALAGTCDVSDPSNAVCNGIFIDSNISFAIDDLTIVVGDDLATVIQPLDGYAGIDLYAANGSITLTSAADILTSHAAAISVRAPNGDVHVENSGNLEVSYADGIEAISYVGNVTVINDGAIDVFGTRGIEAVSHDGDVIVTNTAGSSVSVVSADANAIGIYAYSVNGNVSITNEGVVDASTVSYGVSAHGINAFSFAGDVSVDNSGDITAATNGDVIGLMEAYGIYAASHDGDVTVSNSGNVTATAGGTAGSAPYVYAVMNGAGIVAVSHGGDVSVANSGVVDVSAPGQAQYGSSVWGIVVHSETGDVSVSNSETGSITVVEPYGYANGINAYSHSGGVAVDNAGSIDVGSTYGAAVAIAAMNKYGTNAVTVSNSGDLAVSGYGTSLGITVRAASGPAMVDNSGTITVESIHGGAATGVSAQSKYAAVDIGNSGTVTATSTDTAYSHGTAMGISALSVYDGDIHVSNAGDISATAYGANGVVATAKYSDVVITNSADGSITVDGARVAGIDATSKYDGSVVIDNAGSIAVTGRYQAVGVYANTMYGYVANPGAIAITNSGEIDVSSSNFLAFGVFAQGYNGISVTNSGDITATGYYANAVIARDVFGDALVDNQTTGTITADAFGGDALGVLAQSIYGTAVVNNAGVISVSSVGRATGVAASSYYGVAEVINSETGSIQVNGATEVFGALVYGNEVARLTNYGSIVAEADADSGMAVAYGSITAAGISVTLNYGSITADATVAGAGTALAFGALSYGNAATIVNDGSIAATSEVGDGVAVAMGGYAYGEFNGVYNYGDIAASASAANGQAYAYGVNSIGIGGSSVYNSSTGGIAAAATVVDGVAVSAGVNNYGYYNAYLTNEGDISATSSVSGTGYAYATGASNFALGDAILVNNGGIAATASVETGLANAIGVDNIGVYWNASVTNDGSIAATATAATGYAYATGVSNVGYYGDSLTANTGSITADALLGYGYVRVNGVASQGETVTVNNDGVISASASVELGNAVTVGVYSIANTFSTLTNGVDGSISAEASSGAGVAYGADAAAYGAFVGGSSALIANYGSISAEATLYGGQGIVTAVGAGTLASFGFATILNYGDISAEAVSASIDASYAFAYGTNSTPAYTYLPSAATTANAGNISANATVYLGNAVSQGTTTFAYYAATYNDAGATISATSTAEFSGRADAVGVSTVGLNDALDVNAGTITAYAVAHGLNEYGRFTYGASNATGVEEFSGAYGSATLVNYGDIGATAVALDSRGFFHGGARAVGVDQYGKYYAGINNHGDITAAASTTLGMVSAYGTIQEGRYGFTTYLGNHAGANIIATASSGSASGDYAGGRAVAYGSRMYGGSSAIEYNFGLISASATVDPNDRDYFSNPGQAYAVGSGQSGSYGSTLSNYGDVRADASADFGYATAFGAKVLGAYYVATHNEGAIVAIANADDGNAFAVGSYTLSPGQRSFEGCTPDYSACYYSYAGGSVANDNQGGIWAESSADSGVAYAYGSVAISRLGTVTTNSGSITAIARAEHGTVTAAGSVSNSVDGVASLGNTGTIIASASGDYASTTGALVVGSYGDVGSGYYAASATNAGSITALADGTYGSTATALDVAGRYTSGVHVLNDVGGEISAVATGADAAATAVSLSSNGYNTLVNRGSIVAVASGENATHIAVSSNDAAVATINNYGVIQGSILTGSLDDTLVNHAGATLVLGDDTIDLGAHAGAGNTFVNDGMIVVRGASNVIDMGQGLYTVVPSLNPIAFDHHGTIDFLDGAADDLLTITGDFGGDGQINVDVSGLHGASDMLYVDGSVVDGSVSTVNVNLLDMPTTASSSISVVRVSGDSTEGSFVLGNVNYARNSFLALAFDTGLVGTVDASNARADVFSLGVQVTGLNDTGTLAASIAPGAQSLMTTQVGTWRQRMGVIDTMAKGGLNLWARVFQDEGTIEPALVESNFGQGGNFAFDQKNSGTEVGVDFALTDMFSAGLLLAQADAKQTLNGAGMGSSRIEGNTVGVYGTVLSPGGFYLDTSYRRMSFDARVSSTGGEVQGDADAFNVELGYAWTLGNGLKIEPQFQSTWTQVASMGALSGDLANFDVDGGNSWRSRLGVMVRKSFGTGSAVWTPYASLNTVREFDGKNGYSINDNFFGATSIEGTSMLVEGGLSVQAGKLSVFGGFNWQDGGALQSFGGGQLGVRYTW